MNCMEFPRGMILDQEGSLYYIIKEEINHKALQGLSISLVSEDEANQADSKEYFCFKNDLFKDREVYYMIDCRKSIFLNNEKCNYICSTNEKIYSLCVTVYMLNSFGISPLEFMTNITILNRQDDNEEADEDTAEETTELPGRIETDDINVSLKMLAEYLNFAKDKDTTLDPDQLLHCMNCLSTFGSYNKLYHEIYKYLFNVSKSKMIDIITKSKKALEPPTY